MSFGHLTKYGYNHSSPCLVLFHSRRRYHWLPFDLSPPPYKCITGSSCFKPRSVLLENCCSVGADRCRASSSFWSGCLLVGWGALNQCCLMVDPTQILGRRHHRPAIHFTPLTPLHRHPKPHSYEPILWIISWDWEWPGSVCTCVGNISTKLALTLGWLHLNAHKFAEWGDSFTLTEHQVLVHCGAIIQDTTAAREAMRRVEELKSYRRRRWHKKGFMHFFGVWLRVSDFTWWHCVKLRRAKNIYNRSTSSGASTTIHAVPPRNKTCDGGVAMMASRRSPSPRWGRNFYAKKARVCSFPPLLLISSSFEAVRTLNYLWYYFLITTLINKTGVRKRARIMHRDTSIYAYVSRNGPPSTK